MSEFKTREKALECIIKDKDYQVKDENLRQLRNLHRWEMEINDKLKEKNFKPLYIYNDVNSALRPKNFTVRIPLFSLTFMLYCIVSITVLVYNDK